MKETERKKVTKAFTEYWKDRGDKKVIVNPSENIYWRHWFGFKTKEGAANG